MKNLTLTGEELIKRGYDAYSALELEGCDQGEIEQLEREIGGIEELKKWMKAGFSAKRAVEWKKEGFDYDEALIWRYYVGISSYCPETAREWKEAGFDYEEAKSWRNDANFSYAAEAKRWKEAGFSAEEAREWVNASFTVDEASEYKYKRKIFDANVAEFVRAGFTKEEAKKWVEDYLRQGGGVKGAKEWKEAGFSAWEASAWERGGFYDVEKVRKYKELGFDARTAALYKKLGLFLVNFLTKIVIHINEEGNFEKLEMRKKEAYRKSRKFKMKIKDDYSYVSDRIDVDIDILDDNDKIFVGKSYFRSSDYSFDDVDYLNGNYEKSWVTSNIEFKVGKFDEKEDYKDKDEEFICADAASSGSGFVKEKWDGKIIKGQGILLKYKREKTETWDKWTHETSISTREKYILYVSDKRLFNLLKLILELKLAREVILLFPKEV